MREKLVRMANNLLTAPVVTKRCACSKIPLCLTEWSTMSAYTTFKNISGSKTGTEYHSSISCSRLVNDALALSLRTHHSAITLAVDESCQLLVPYALAGWQATSVKPRLQSTQSHHVIQNSAYCVQATALFWPATSAVPPIMA